VGVGPFFSNVVLFIVILTTAISLDRQADGPRRGKITPLGGARCAHGCCLYRDICPGGIRITRQNGTRPQPSGLLQYFASDIRRCVWMNRGVS